MNIKKQLLGSAIGYMFAILIAYFFFDYFSWSFTIGSLLGILFICSNFKVYEKEIDPPLIMYLITCQTCLHS